MKPIIDQYQSLKDKAQHLSSSITKNTSEFNNALFSLHMLENRIDNLLEQIIPTFEFKHKSKRGLFNPLGTFIKSITGNLDQNDAEEINIKITALQQMQNKLKTDAINRITLIDSTVQKFQKMISNITHNEIILKSRILQIEQAIKEAKLLHEDMKIYFQTFAIINQITLLYQSIYNILDTLEIAISFAKSNTLHNSIIDPKHLLLEIKKLEPHFQMNKLPVQSNIENILILEKLIEIKCYLKETSLIFILEIPLVESDMYQYFEVFPLPVLNDGTFWVNIPHKPYLALHNSKYQYMSSRCQEMVPEQFLCKRTHSSTQEKLSPCEVQLLNHEPNITSCHPFQLEVASIQITKVADGKWIIIVPTRITAKLSCQENEETMPLMGTYLAEVPIDCQIKMQSIMLQTFKPNQLQYQELILPQLDFSQMRKNQSKGYQPPSLDLDAVNIKEVDQIRVKLQEQKKELSEFSSNVYVNRVSFWTIVLYIGITCLIIYFIILRFVPKYFKKHNDPENCENVIIV